MSSTFSRKSIRFPADKNSIVYLKKTSETNHEPSIDHVGLVSNEAAKGFGAVFINSFNLSQGDQCLVKVGELAALHAQVAWIKDIDEDVVKVGFEYLD